MIRFFYTLIRNFSRQAGKKNISAFAASTAFFIFLSLVPMLILLCTILPYTPLTEENLVAAAAEIVPTAVQPLVKGVIEEVYSRSVGILSLAALTTLWSAGKGVVALMRGLNAINDVDEERNYFLIRAIAALYMVILLAVTVLSLLLMVFGNQLMHLVLLRIPQLRVLISFLMNFRFIAVWLVLTVFFCAIYAYVPNKKLHFRDQLPGASFAAVVWSIFSWGFSLYIDKSPSYSIYGSLSIIIIAMVWMYFCMYIILMGAYINHFFSQMEPESGR